MTNEKCLVELDEVLKYLILEDLNKIPVEIRNKISERKDKKYKWQYDDSKPLNEQKLNRKTIAMLSYLCMEYMQNEEQRRLMQEIHKLNEKELTKAHIKKENATFENNITTAEKNEVSTLLSVDTLKWYQKVFKYVKKIFKR